ncbi:hypothetical protein [Paraburkholderia susongensis]|uniref:hypothetical protein n=1 Tax=Paraburkholderia susongensis TaxID=1515439 RepID=UPI00142D6E78|nr:hypothetical protein [Paraburkholderia susongensis]
MLDERHPPSKIVGEFGVERKYSDARFIFAQISDIGKPSPGFFCLKFASASLVAKAS